MGMIDVLPTIGNMLDIHSDYQLGKDVFNIKDGDNTVVFVDGSYLTSKIYYKHLEHKTGIQVPLGTQVGEGLRFFHHDCIIIAQTAKIGKNASIHQGVTIGRVFNGPYAGVPIIGNNVVIFAGAKVLGNIHVGDGAVIGANAVVTTNVPANCVVAGVPAKIISENSDKCFTKQWGECFAHGYYE